MAVIRLSSSSLFSLSFLTRLSMALFEKDSDSPPCLWHMREWTMLRQASAEVGATAVTFAVAPEVEEDDEVEAVGRGGAVVVMAAVVKVSYFCWRLVKEGPRDRDLQRAVSEMYKE